MEFTDSLKLNYEFRRLYQKGRSFATPFLVVYCRKNGRGVNRLGLTASGKLGNAVTRNRVRRRLREIYRLAEGQVRRGYDIVVVARTRSVTAEYAQLDKAFLRACRELGLLTEETK